MEQLSPITAERPGTALSDAVLRHLDGAASNDYSILSLIEKALGGEPKPYDTLENAPSQLSYSTEGDVIQLWIRGIPVDDLKGKNEQALLKHFCQNPEDKISGRRLEKRLGKQLKNASKAAKAVKDAMRDVDAEAGDWFLTDPLRWAPGVTPVPHSRKPSIPSAR